MVKVAVFVLAVLALPHCAALRVLTFNMWTPVVGGGANATQRMETFLKEVHEYDVLVLQEVFNVHLLGWMMMGYAKWLVAELNIRGFMYTVLPAGIEEVFTIEDDGLLIASRFPLRNTSQILYKSSVFTDTWTRKGAIITRIHTLDRSIVVVNTHLHAYKGESNVNARFDQLVQLSAALNTDYANEYTLLCGDFNFEASSHEYDVVIQLLRARDTGMGLLTYPSKNADVRIDYILLLNAPADADVTATSPHLCATHAGKSYNGCSDHWPLTVTV
jgi:endonuclease/exonuclease/phosphatase family metal-dependent hydrolase